VASRTGLTLDDMAAQLGVVPRSVQRYLRDLEAAGWAEPAEPLDDGRKRWRASADARRDISLSVAPTELLAQRIALQATEPVLAGTELHDALRSLTGKVEAAMPGKLRSLVASAQRAFPVVARPGRNTQPGPEVMEDLLQAYLEHRVLQAEYRALSHGGAVKHYRLEPVALFHHRGALYLGAFAGSHDKPLRFAVDRFVDVTLTDERFTPPETYSEQQFVEQSFGVFDGDPLSICVRFDAAVAPGVRERRWHPTQTLTELPDGGVEVRFVASGWPEIRAWVLGYGRLAELIEPAERRREIAGELRAAAKRYGGRR
jgi:proteasome accessory factor B